MLSISFETMPSAPSRQGTQRRLHQPGCSALWRRRANLGRRLSPANSSRGPSCASPSERWTRIPGDSAGRKQDPWRDVFSRRVLCQPDNFRIAKSFAHIFRRHQLRIMTVDLQLTARNVCRHRPSTPISTAALRRVRSSRVTNSAASRRVDRGRRRGTNSCHDRCRSRQWSRLICWT